MKFFDKETGELFEDIENYIWDHNCKSKSCDDCPINKKLHEKKISCRLYLSGYKKEVAVLMGYEIIMEFPSLIEALNRLKVETGSLACLGCGYENNCSINGCAIIRKAILALAPDNPPLTVGELQDMHGQSAYMSNGWACVVNAAERKIITVHGWYPFSAIDKGCTFYRHPPVDISACEPDVDE